MRKLPPRILLVLHLVWSLGLGQLSASHPPDPALYVVSVPVADLRAQPRTRAQQGAHDPLQETQVLYGERVRLRKTDGLWAFVEAIEQPEYTHHRRWEGYPGWIRTRALQPLRDAPAPNAIITSKWAAVWADAQGTRLQMRLPIGAVITVTPKPNGLYPLRLLSGTSGWIRGSEVRILDDAQPLPEAQRRQLIVREAELFLGDGYFWGGRSPSHGPSDANRAGGGVDCSGLVNLAHRAAGIHIPRDAHEQSLRARPVTQLQPADVIFLSKPNDPSTIVHVMLYAGDGRLIEAPGTGLVVRRISVAERLGRPLERLKP